MDDSTGWREVLALTALKGRYCRYLDTKRWEQWRELFTDDFVSDTSTAGGQVITGADEFVRYIRAREDIRTPLVSVRLSPRLRDAGAALARRSGR